MSDPLIALIEELAANAWPAAVALAVDGWRLRFNWGVTRRANSVWPNAAEGRHSREEKISLAEDFYRRRETRPRFQMTPAAQPPDLDEILAQRGYATDARTAVQTADLANVLAQAPPHPEMTVSISEQFDEAWFTAYCESEGFDGHVADMRRGILKRIAPRIGYAHLEIESSSAAVGVGVVERGWLGVFGMTTRPAYRRRGAASAVLRALAEWGKGLGAAEMYLQVMENNAPARALYAGVGFETLYHYHYRESPE